MVLSAMYLYWFGVAVGFSLGKIGFTALGMAYVSQRSQSLPWILKVVSLWGSSVVRKLFTVFRWPMFLFGLYVCLCIFIRIESRDIYVRDALATFPKSCHASASSPTRGCDRVTIHVDKDNEDDASKRSGGFDTAVNRSIPVGTLWNQIKTLGQGSRHERSIHIDTQTCTSVDSLAAEIQQWVLQSFTFSRLLRSDQSMKKEHTYMHFRVLSTIFGFADDFLIRVSAEKDSRTITIIAQGQLRLGVSDLGVNAQRNMKLVEFIQELCAKRTSGR